MADFSKGARQREKRPETEVRAQQREQLELGAPQTRVGGREVVSAVGT